ncbi:MAG: conjugal transfer protein [Methylomonas sp.]|nr:MAG: conjugal transfer protein [Methylomonas sp.]
MKNLANKAASVTKKTVYRSAASLALLFGLSQSALAQPAGGGGLAKAGGILTTFTNELTTIIPIFAALALLVLGVGYATKFVEKDTFVRWGIGIIIAGSAAQITALFFT